MKRGLLTGPRLLLALLTVAIGAAILFALRTPPLNVEVGRVVRGPLVVTIDELGETRVSDLYVVSAPTTGRLTRVPLKAGTRVDANRTLLARIEPVQPDPIDARSFARAKAEVAALRSQLAAANARIAQLRAEQTLAERDFGRASDLAGRGFVSGASLDRARSARDRARAGLAEATQSANATAHSLQAAEANLLVTTSSSGGRGSVAVRSPVSGFVMRVPQESERVVVAGTPLAEIGNPERLEIVTDLLSADAVRVQPGNAVLIEDWGGNRALHGRVRLVEPFGFTKISALGVEEQRVNVVIDFVEPRDAWQRVGHGYRATVRIVVSSVADAVKVPIGALFRSQGKWSVFTLAEGGRARLVGVEVGAMNDEEAAIVRGLSPGDRVILHPSDKVRQDVRVRKRY